MGRGLYCSLLNTTPDAFRASRAVGGGCDGLPNPGGGAPGRGLSAQTASPDPNTLPARAAKGSPGANRGSGNTGCCCKCVVEVEDHPKSPPCACADAAKSGPTAATAGSLKKWCAPAATWGGARNSSRGCAEGGFWRRRRRRPPSKDAGEVCVAVDCEADVWWAPPPQPEEEEGASAIGEDEGLGRLSRYFPRLGTFSFWLVGKN